MEDETHNEDGKHIGFLDDNQYNGCDDELREALRAVVEQKRSVSALEEQGLIHKASYFSEILMPPEHVIFRAMTGIQRRWKPL